SVYRLQKGLTEARIAGTGEADDARALLPAGPPEIVDPRENTGSQAAAEMAASCAPVKATATERASAAADGPQVDAETGDEPLPLCGQMRLLGRIDEIPTPEEA